MSGTGRSKNMSTEKTKGRYPPASAEGRLPAGAESALRSGCAFGTGGGASIEEGMPLAEKKRALRAEMKALRAAIPDRAERDARIFDKLFSFPAFAGAESVFIYCSLAQEADTRRIIGELLARGKRIYLPRTEGKDMLAVRYEGGELRMGKFGVCEPLGEETTDKPEVCVLPLLAADGQFRRLGYGGGYYDRYFSCKGKDMRKIGVCYDFQLIGEVPSEAHDVRLDAIVTDARVLVRESSEVL